MGPRSASITRKSCRPECVAVLAALEESPDPEEHRGDLADLVAELTESGMDFYYMRALRLAERGYVAQQSARLGMSGAVRMISTVSRQFIMRMDGKAQLLRRRVAHSQSRGIGRRCPTSTASPCS